MKHLLLLLLATSAVGAVEMETPGPITMQSALVAHPVGARAPARARGAEMLVFDSLIDASNISAANSAANTLVGMPVHLDAAAGQNPEITRMVVYLVYIGTTAQTFDSLRVRVQVWDAWAIDGEPVFSGPSAMLIEHDVPGPITLQPNASTPIELTLSSPIPLSGLYAHGIAVNFQGDTGAGLQSSDKLTSLLRNGANPIGVGANALPDHFGYLDFDGRGDFNFGSIDSVSFGHANQAMVLLLFATPPPPIGQEITNAVATPAIPILGDGTFTVSATGGASGNPVVFSIFFASASVCTAGGTHGATITMLTAGLCRIRANQAGNDLYAAAPTLDLAVDIGHDGLVEDGGFEAGDVPTYWALASTNFGSPICVDGCTEDGFPRTGVYFSWFGGTTRAETASVRQIGRIAPIAKTLDFHVWWNSPTLDPPDPAAVFNVTMDGDTLFTLTAATAAAYSAGYTLASVDISAYADGNPHTLRFETNNAASTGVPAMDLYLDDISVVSGMHIFGDGLE